MNQLQTVLDKLEPFVDTDDGCVNVEILNAMAIINNMMQVEPVAWANLEDGFHTSDRVVMMNKDAAKNYSDNCYTLTPLYAAPQAVPVWLPIETAPKDGTEVLVGHKDGSQAVVFWQYRKRTGTAGWRDGDCDLINWPTHWMPLPAAPKGAA